jgi:hypothetical protein
VFVERPFVLLGLRRLIPPAPDAARRYSGRLFIRYRTAPDGRPTNHIELAEVDVVPAGAKLIALLPETEQAVTDIRAIQRNLPTAATAIAQ